MRHPIYFISLLSSLTKETRHLIDGINLCVHNHIRISLSCLTVLMIKQHTTTLLFTLDFVTLLLFLIVKDMYINLIYITLTCYIEIIAYYPLSIKMPQGCVIRIFIIPNLGVLYILQKTETSRIPLLSRLLPVLFRQTSIFLIFNQSPN